MLLTVHDFIEFYNVQVRSEFGTSFDWLTDQKMFLTVDVYLNYLLGAIDIDDLSKKIGAFAEHIKPVGVLMEIHIFNPEYERDVVLPELKAKIANPSKIKLTRKQFLNLLKTAPDKMRSGSAVEKDRIARILFLNLRVDNKKALSFIWREPFDSLVKAIEMSSGADERT